jgi:hypothetical protein
MFGNLCHNGLFYSIVSNLQLKYNNHNEYYQLNDFFKLIKISGVQLQFIGKRNILKAPDKPLNVNWHTATQAKKIESNTSNNLKKAINPH